MRLTRVADIDHSLDGHERTIGTLHGYSDVVVACAAIIACRRAAAHCDRRAGEGVDQEFRCGLNVESWLAGVHCDVRQDGPVDVASHAEHVLQFLNALEACIARRPRQARAAIVIIFCAMHMQEVIRVTPVHDRMG